MAEREGAGRMKEDEGRAADARTRATVARSRGRSVHVSGADMMVRALASERLKKSGVFEHTDALPQHHLQFLTVHARAQERHEPAPPSPPTREKHKQETQTKGTK